MRLGKDRGGVGVAPENAAARDIAPPLPHTRFPLKSEWLPKFGRGEFPVFRVRCPEGNRYPMVPGMDEITEFGPAMSALTPKQRLFVLAMLADPFGNAARWARAAGYSDVKEGAKVRGFKALHSPAVRAAAFELARGQLDARGPILAVEGLLRVAAKPKHKKHLQALLEVANRVGFPASTEHNVNVNHSDRTGMAMVERIAKIAGMLGIDPGQLLGVNAAPKLIEGKVIDAQQD